MWRRKEKSQPRYLNRQCKINSQIFAKISAEKTFHHIARNKDNNGWILSNCKFLRLFADCKKEDAPSSW